MGSIPPDFPVSLKSWPPANSGTALPTIVGRINHERIDRGGFRALTEENLQREIEEEELEQEDDSDEEQETDPTDRLKEIHVAKGEMLQHIGGLLYGAQGAHDFVSFLLSKHMPHAAARQENKVSQMWDFMRQNLPMGSLGMDKIKEPTATQEQKEDNKSITRGWKVQNLNKTVDSILASATRLEKEIELETKYWDQVLSIDEEGWAICRIPQEKHTLGVRFGFLEGAANFRSLSMAALRRGEDGSILLDRGMGTEPKAIRVRIRSDDRLASSRVPVLIEDESPVQFRILQARNTVFASELWQELTREARTLLDFGVSFEGDTIVCPLTSDKKIILDLVSLDESEPISAHPDQKLADGLLLGLQLLLSYAHRQNHYRRTMPPAPLKANKEELPVYALIRPILTRLNHQISIDSMHSLLGSIIRTLKSAGLSPSYTQAGNPATPGISNRPTEQVILSLIDKLEVRTVFHIQPNISIAIVSQTDMFPVTSTKHTISLFPPNNPLNLTCPPPDFPVDTWDQVQDYILFATSCALASQVLNSQSHTPEEALDEESESWQVAVNPNSVFKRYMTTGKQKYLVFQMEKIKGKDVVKCRAKWEWISDAPKTGDGTYEWTGGEGAKWEDGEELIKPLSAIIVEAGKP